MSSKEEKKSKGSKSDTPPAADPSKKKDSVDAPAEGKPKTKKDRGSKVPSAPSTSYCPSCCEHPFLQRDMESPSERMATTNSSLVLSLF